MFDDFAKVWTPVIVASDLGASRPIATEIAGTPVVLFRDKSGRASALIDRCPHRGVKLSLGVVKDGCIECPFHGWQLDGEGHVCHVPWNPDAKLQNLSGIALPTREIAGQIWVYTDPFEPPTSEPAVHEALLRPGVRICGEAVEWDTHWTRAMENMLDWPHLPFVHKGTIGRGMQGKTQARMEITSEERPYGLHTHIQIDGQREQSATLDLRWPNQMNLDLSSKGRLMFMHVACVPVGPNKTRMLLMMARDFMTAPWLDWAFNWSNRKIASEDKLVVESSFPAEIPRANEEKSVRTDAPTLHFRKRYFAELKGKSAGKRALPIATE